MKKSFIYFRFGEFVAAFSNNVMQIAMIWWVLQISNSTTLSLVLFFSTFFRVLSLATLNPIGDLFPSKKLLIYLRILASFICLFLSVFFAGKNTVSILLPVVLIISLNIIDGVALPISVGLIPKIVAKERLKDAIRFEGVLQAFSIITGKVMGGLVIGLIGIAISSLSAAIGFLAASKLTSLIKLTEHPRIKEGNLTHVKIWFKQLFAGYKLLVNIPIELYWAIISTLINLCLTPFVLLGIPYLVKNVFHSTAITLGILESAIACGMLVGSILTVKLLGRLLSDDKICFLGLFVSGLTILITPLLKSIFLVCISLFILGNCIVIHNISANARRMMALPQNYRSRIIGTAKMLIEIGVPIGFLMLGYLINKIGIDYSLIIFGLIPTIISPFLFLIPQFTKLMRCSYDEANNFYFKNSGREN